MMPVASSRAVSVVMITQNRREEALASVSRLLQLSDVEQVIVVDNASSDGTSTALRTTFKGVVVIDAGENLGAAGRTLGVRRAVADVVAFADDDSGWAPGALRRSVSLFEQYPNLGLLQGAILVSSDQRRDPTCNLMATALAPDSHAPGIPITGFLTCGAVVRKEAYLSVAGFNPKLGMGGEEALLAIDLLCAGWHVQYVDDVVAYHWPSPLRDRFDRRVSVQRNDLWTCWMRRHPSTIAGQTWTCVKTAMLGDRVSRRAFLAALRGLGWVTRQRRRVPLQIEKMLRACESRRAAIVEGATRSR